MIATGNTTNGKPSIRADGSYEPYAWTPLQRTIMLTIHQERRPMGVEDFVLKLAGGGRGHSTVRSRIKRTMELLVEQRFGRMIPHPEMPDEQALEPTNRGTEIALNITAAAMG